MTKRCLSIKTITQKKVEERVSYHTEKYGDKIEKGITNIEIKGLQKGRVRSRDPMEKEILNRFKR